MDSEHGLESRGFVAVYANRPDGAFSNGCMGSVRALDPPPEQRSTIRSTFSIEVRLMTMSTKDEYTAQIKAQLDEWADDLADLRAKAADASDDVKDKLDLEIAELKVKWDEADARRRELLDAADDHWDDMKDAAQAQWTDLKAGVKDGIERMKSLFS